MMSMVMLTLSGENPTMSTGARMQSMEKIIMLEVQTIRSREKETSSKEQEILLCEVVMILKSPDSS